MGSKRLDVTTYPSGGGINGELHACQLAIAASGGALTLDEALGVSGLAFRFVFGMSSDGAWDEASLERYSTPEHPCVLAAAYAGCTYTPHLKNTLAEMFDKAKAGIEAGVPVVTRGPVGPPEASLFVGYSDDGPVNRLDVLSEFAGDQITPLEIPPIDMDYVAVGQWRNPVFIVGPGDPPSAEAKAALLSAALDRASDVATAGAIGDDFLCGEAAFLALADSLESGFDASWDAEDRDGQVAFVGRLFGELSRSRAAAAAFLATATDASDQAADAAAAYAKIAEPLASLAQIFPDPFESESQHQHVRGALNSEEHRVAAAGWLRHIAEVDGSAAATLGSGAFG